MRIALYEPDIPQNTGTILRLCACFGIEAHIIEPSGFPTTDRAFRRAGMDYLDAVTIVRHRSWQDFAAWRSGVGTSPGCCSRPARRSPISTTATEPTTSCCSAGSPQASLPKSATRPMRGWKIPMRDGLRSLNVAIAAAMAAGEALRQTGGDEGLE